MGHAIHYLTVNEKESRKTVMDKIQAHAKRDGDGYASKMTWHDEVTPLSSIEEAKTFVTVCDNGWYDDHAVRYFDYSEAEETAKIKELRAKRAALGKAKREYENNHSVKRLQAKYIGCPKCGSKINKDYLLYENCPLCGEDLRAKTTLDKIKWYEKKIEELVKRIDEEKRKQKSKVKIKWLVKYEYHC